MSTLIDVLSAYLVYLIVIGSIGFILFCVFFIKIWKDINKNKW